jgi:hypothetical protein
MSNLTRYVFGLALILGYLGYYSVAQSQTKPVKKTLTGTVSCRVTIKGKGAPGVVVGLRAREFGPQPAPSIKAGTDQDGYYRIRDVPAGIYQVEPIVPALVISDLPAYGSRGKGLVITEGEAVDGIDFALLRGGVITGKVTDAEGRAVIDEPINLLRLDPINKRGWAYSFAPRGFQTDDRGIYRIFGVPAGRYKVAIGQSEDSFFRRFEEGRPSYKQTFHPDVSDPAKATVIDLAEGAEARDVNIAVVRPIQGFAASGRVVDGATGEPVANVRFGLQMTTDEQQGSFMNTLSSSNSQGEFRIENLTPGKYAVVILPQQDRDLQADAVAFEVADQDIAGLLVKTSKGASLAGTVVLEGTDVADGDYDLTAESSLGPGETAVSDPRRVTVRGTDVTGIELTTKPLGSISGSIALENSTAPECKNKRQPLFSETLVTARRHEKRGKKNQPRLLRFFTAQGSPNKAGDFMLRNLAPGEHSLSTRFFAKYWYFQAITLQMPAAPTATERSASVNRPVNAARSWVNLKLGERLTGLTITLAEGAASLRGRITGAESDKLPPNLFVYLIPTEKEQAEDVLRFFTTAVTADGSFSLGNLPPGRYWAITRIVAENRWPDPFKLRMPDEADNRVKLRRDAELAKTSIELKPCQNVLDYQLPFKSSSLESSRPATNQ